MKVLTFGVKILAFGVKILTFGVKIVTFGVKITAIVRKQDSKMEMVRKAKRASSWEPMINVTGAVIKHNTWRKGCGLDKGCGLNVVNITGVFTGANDQRYGSGDHTQHLGMGVWLR